MNPSSTLKNNYLNKILQNALFEKMYAEQHHGNENLVIVPLRNEYFSQHVKNKAGKPLQYLLLVENSDGKIRKGDLILFFPEDDKLQKLPSNSFHDFFNSEYLSVNGTFTLVSLNDVKQYEMIFKDGMKDRFKLWQGKKEVISGNNNMPTANSLSQNCTEWYLVTTYYENGIIVGVTEEYLGTTCSGCPPNNTECMATEVIEGSGGGAVETPVAVSRSVNFMVKKEATSYENWEIKAYFTVTGYSFNNSSNNYFTSISWTDTGIQYLSFAASSSNPAHARFSIFNEMHHSSGIINSATTATAHSQTKMYYPNWPELWNPQGAGPTKTEYYGMPHSWQANVVLY